MSDATAAARRPRAARAPARRPSQILDAAARLLLRDGHGKVTIEGIAVEAGLGKGTVYEYYGSKAEIFTALRARYTQQTLTAGLAAAPPGTSTPALARLQRFIAGMFAFVEANGELLALLFHQAGVEEPDELAPITEKLLEMVQDGTAAGELAAVADAEFTVEFLIHGLHGVMEDALLRGQDRQQVLTQVNAILTALLSPARSPR